MKKDLELAILELQKCLYPDNNQEIDNISLKRTLYNVLRECLKANRYEIEVGDYTINVNPKNLLVTYESNHTMVEVSNEDVYYETVRDIETRLFCISSLKKDEFLSDNPVIATTGVVSNIDGICEEHISFELVNNIDDSIHNYLNLPSDVKLVKQPNENDYNATVKRRITPDQERTDIIDLLDKNKVVPVFYDSVIDKYKTQTDRRTYTPNNYVALLPSLDNLKSTITFLYSSMVEFYTEYLNND